MLGFGKKKKKEEKPEEPEEKETTAAPSPGKKDKGQAEADGEPLEETPPPKKKKIITKKRIIILLMLLAIGACSFAAYKIFFTGKGADTPVYHATKLPHVNLPEEMLEFSFNHFPDLYVSLVDFNGQVILFDREIARIEAIAQKYPEQQKITKTEKKVLEKGKNTLVKVFLKLEKPIKETYVLFQVNETQGLVRIEEKRQELTDTAQNALKTALEQTKKFQNQGSQVPEGLLQGTLYKLKKKFQ